MMNNGAYIWVVDDERIVRVSLADDLRDAGYKVKEFSNANSVLSAFSTNEFPDIIITDIKMPGIDGVELLKKIKDINNNIQVLMMTAFGSVENAVETMKLGAYDYILKPFNKDEILLNIIKILELKKYREENKLLKENIAAKYDFTKYIGDKKDNNQLFDLIKLVVHKDTTVLITGETGTGKELITNIIHYNSERRTKPFIKVSCAILARDIFESELFGYEKGAFTGAQEKNIGRFERAHGGTLYLDDIDDIPLELQVKLLRALEEREIERLGGAQTIKIDVRLIASTKKNLLQLVQKGNFREDLYYRLNVFPINLPPLRERHDDIKILIEHFMRHFSTNPDISITSEALDVLLNYPFPGNVRELRNIMERLVLLAPGGIIELKHIPGELINRELIHPFLSVGTKPLNEMLTEYESIMIRQALQKANNNKSRAADLLGIPATTLYSKIDKLKIS